ncbi:MAG: 4Fe-4S binding protein [Candidatus Omnitrophota bacterium]
MSKRKIIKIDEDKCNGCTLCIPNCPEGAIQIIDQKARLLSDLFCDGLGACIGHCPEGAISIEEREAEKYDEKKVMENIVKQGENVIGAHLEHLKAHGESEYLKQAQEYLKEKGIKLDGAQEPHGHHHASGSSGCPGMKVMDFRQQEALPQKGIAGKSAPSRLRHWPVQLMLVPATAPYLNNADLLIAADCVPFAYASFHEDLLRDRILLVGCPKLDNAEIYRDKISQILKHNTIKSVTYAHMEVPCCFGLAGIISQAIAQSGKDIAFQEATISIKGERLL